MKRRVGHSRQRRCPNPCSTLDPGLPCAHASPSPRHIYIYIYICTYVSMSRCLHAHAIYLYIWTSLCPQMVGIMVLLMPAPHSCFCSCWDTVHLPAPNLNLLPGKLGVHWLPTSHRTERNLVLVQVFNEDTCMGPSAWL